jgi:hypothetical protein
VDALTRAAITGTSRESPPASGLPTDDLLGYAEGKGPERDLLLRAGMRAVYRTAGRRAESRVEAPQIALEEALPVCSAEAAELLRQLLVDQRNTILLEALERLRLAGLRLPHVLLPGALNVEQKELRSAVAAVLGERGRWLAGFNPAWVWATVTESGGKEEDYEAAWQEGALPERLEALRCVRGRDEDQGLFLVEDVWKAEKADARAAMVAALETRLSPDDEPFLERALDDRSVRVREEAAALLARIPGSAYAERAAARADSVLVSYEPPASGLQSVAAGLTGRGRAGWFVVEHVNEGWTRDLPGSDKPPQGVGEKAWRISHALAVMPPEHWEERFGVGPSGLVIAARGDWEAALLSGWCRAVRLHRSRGWAMPLWEHCYGISDDFVGRLTWEAALSLAPILPQEEFSAALPGLFFGGASEMSLRLSATLQAVPSPWRLELSEVYLDRLRQRLKGFETYGQARGEDPWLFTLPHAASSLSPESLAGAVGLRELLGEWAGKGNFAMLRWERELEIFEETLELRRRLVKEIPL